ncbi:MAG: ATP-dependent nuclease [Thermoleophilaceae bacterium]
MRLISLQLHGFRRFAERTKVVFDGKLTALVGPNEAGKTTVLDALRRLDDSEPINQLDRTRGMTFSDDAVALEALWLIERSDIAEIEIPDGQEVPRWLIVKKQFSGRVRTALVPRFHRSLTPRKRLVSVLKASRARPALIALAESGDSQLEVSVLDDLIHDLDRDVETLGDETIAQARAVADHLDPDVSTAPNYVRALPVRLRAVAEYEAREHPDRAARRILYGRTPDFLRFTLEERQLASEYDLNEVIADPRQALTNLANLAELDLTELRDAIASGNRGGAIELRDAANARLRARIDEAWEQSTVEPRFENDDFVLRIFVRTGGGGLQDIAQRSDGLRSFIALVAFTTERASNRPAVLLIDEAEIHLHYDAQADLVQMLSHQHQAPQVVYTTHSAGCLPEDLGTGVRIVVPAEGGDTSTVDNWPWEAEGGFGPLLLGMGASTLAFVPTRAAVIAEGASEVVLLPTIIREAVDVASLDYQVAPGAAEASRAAAAHIDYQGHRVAWLVDGDSGGRDNRRHLERSGVPKDRIVTLGGADSGLTIEDLIDSPVFLKAVNAQLQRSHGERVAEMAPEDLPDLGRWNALETWCEHRGVPVPNKGAIAHRIADQRLEHRLTADTHLELLRELHRQFTAIFGPD